MEISNILKEEYIERGWWQNKTIDDLLADCIEQYPNFETLIDPINRTEFTSGEPKRLTFEEINSLASALASNLIKIGYKKGDIIGIFLPNTWELIVSYVAISRLGCIANPYPPGLREMEITKMGSFTGIKGMITTDRFKDRNLTEMVLSVKNDIPTLENIISVGPDNLSVGVSSFTALVSEDYNHQILTDYKTKHSVSPDDLFTICWTSGTTGMPKGVPRTYNLWSATGTLCSEAIGMNHDYVMLCPFPLVNMGGLGGTFFPWLMTGCKYVLHQPFDLKVYLQQIQTEKVTYTLAPPAILNMLLKNEAILSNVDISSLKFIGSGSAPLTSWMTTEWHNRYNIQVTNFFGSNEGIAILGAPSSVPDLEKRATLFPAFGAKGSDYDQIDLIKGMKSKLLDLQTGVEINEPDKPGELFFKGPTIFSGYYKSPEDNKLVFDKDGFFKTGDVFVLVIDEGKKYYRFVERSKDIIIRGGNNIAPAEIESLLQDIPAIAECAIVGYPDPNLGERLALVAVLKEGQAMELSDIIIHLRNKKIASYKLPEKLVLIDALPRNPVGKILRRILRPQVI